MDSRPRHICTISSDTQLAATWRAAIEPMKVAHTAFDGLVTALRRLVEISPDILIADLSATGLSEEQLALKVRHRSPMSDILFAGESIALTSDHAGDRTNWNVITLARDTEPVQLRARLSTILEERAQVVRCRWIGVTQELRSASGLLLAAANSDATVLIEGESGTGKELAARAVHRNSTRAAKPFLAINCSAFPETLLESELFGHEKGAFTDAFGRKKGIFEAVEGGTIFLDEIGETSPAVQSRLLRVLEERQVRPIGATKSLPVDFRVVAATNRHLQQSVADGGFRRDLYFRLAVIQLMLPPLRERRGDTPGLLLHHLTGSKPSLLEFLDEGALARLVSYDWPGNVRELRNFVERAGIRFPGKLLDVEMVGSLLETVRPGVNLPMATGRRADNVEREMIFAALSELKRDLDYLKRQVDRMSPHDSASADAHVGVDHFASMREIERERVALALKESHGNRAQAAKMLGIGERTLYRKIREYGL